MRPSKIKLLKDTLSRDNLVLCNIESKFAHVSNNTNIYLHIGKLIDFLFQKTKLQVKKSNTKTGHLSQ